MRIRDIALLAFLALLWMTGTFAFVYGIFIIVYAIAVGTLIQLAAGCVYFGAGYYWRMLFKGLYFKLRYNLALNELFNANGSGSQLSKYSQRVLAEANTVVTK